jgi:exopolyphosphatase/guanosine-5'-triphosphate,3'-diphosphate pyrophosphatase
LLSFAAQLHQVGFLVGARHYHRHGAYLIANSTMRGFSRQEQRLLSLLVRCHRRRLPNLAFSAFESEIALKAMRLVVLLRIAVILMRGYRQEDDFEPVAEINGKALTLNLSKHWLDTHPLSRKELEVEVDMLADIGFEFNYQVQ